MPKGPTHHRSAYQKMDLGPARWAIHSLGCAISCPLLSKGCVRLRPFGDMPGYRQAVLLCQTGGIAQIGDHRRQDYLSLYLCACYRSQYSIHSTYSESSSVHGKKEYGFAVCPRLAQKVLDHHTLPNRLLHRALFIATSLGNLGRPPQVPSQVWTDGPCFASFRRDASAQVRRLLLWHRPPPTSQPWRLSLSPTHSPSYCCMGHDSPTN